MSNSVNITQVEGNSINVNKTDNTVTLQDQNRRIIVTDNNCETTVDVTQPITEVVTVNTLGGPRGAVGPVGPVGPEGPPVDTSALATTASNIFVGNQTITGSVDITGSLAVSLTQQSLNKIVVWDESDNKFYYRDQTDIDDDWYDGGTFITSSKNLKVTASFTIDIADKGPDFFLIKSGSKTVAQFNNQGVFILGTFDYTPIPQAGGIFYSSSNEFFVGIEE